MNIVIVGMGEVGKYISRVLVEEDHNVVIIDNDPEALQSAEETLDAMVLRGHGANVATLREAGIERADLFIAVTDNSEVNIIASIRARELGASRTIARVAEPEYFEVDRGLHTNMLGIDLVVNPRALVAQELHKIVRSANAVAVEDFANNRIEMIQLRMKDKKTLVNHKIKDIKLPHNTLIAGLIRDQEVVVASGDTVLQEDDEVFIVGKIEQIPRVEKLFERERTRYTRRVVIVGGSQVGAKLAEALSKDGIEVILIDKDRARCWELSEELRHVVILNADGTDMHLLEEERVEAADAFVAVSAHDEVNFLATLLARDIGADRVIALVHKPDYSTVCERLGVHATVSPRLEVAKQVLKYVRAGEVIGITPVLEGKGEFLEFIVPEGARIVGTPIKEVDFPPHANICSVVDPEGAYVPRGDDVIEAGDRVIVFTLPDHRRAVEKFFKKPKA
jgi:trk system potassium uptake protein TrkA